MTAKEIILLVLGGVLANNFVFERFLGLAPLFGAARKGEKLLALGLSVLAVMLVTAPLGWVVQTQVLQPLGLAFLRWPPWCWPSRPCWGSWRTSSSRSPWASTSR